MNQGPGKYWVFNQLEEWKWDSNSLETEYSREYVDGILGKPMIPYYKSVGYQTNQKTGLFQQLAQKTPFPSDEIHPRSAPGQIMNEFGLRIAKEGNDLKLIELFH